QETSTPQSESAKAEVHRIQAVHISEPIKIDGLLNEAAWSTAQAATGFRQESPTEGAPASEQTDSGRATTRCICARATQHESLHRTIQLQLFAQAAHFSSAPIEFRRAPFTDQCAPALHLPTKQRFLHHLQSEYRSGP